ncbi:MAG: alginate export family protein, partial [Acidobacteriota bacterium]
MPDPDAANKPLPGKPWKRPVDRRRRFASPLLAGAVLAAAVATGAGAEPFEYKRIRGEEDWIAGGDARLLGALPTYQAIELAERSWLTLGGEWRLAFERNGDEGWGEVPGADAMALERVMLHAAWTYLPRTGPFDRVRVFAQLKHGETHGRGAEDRVPDVDLLDWNAGFLELRGRPFARGPSARGPSGGQVTLRLGRQELHYGAGRLLATRAGATNTRISYDAALLRYASEPFDIDFFYAFPNETDPDAFDNGHLEGRKLRGFYGTWKRPHGGLDVFSFLDERPQSYFQGRGREKRYTVGDLARRNPGR